MEYSTNEATLFSCRFDAGTFVTCQQGLGSVSKTALSLIAGFCQTLAIEFHSLGRDSNGETQVTDEAWDLIKHLFPKRAETGRPPVDRRLVFDGILWILRTGAPCVIFPKSLVSGKQRGGCLTQWTSDGTIDSILNMLRSAHIDAGKSIRSCGAWMVQLFAQHVCAAGRRKKRDPDEPADQALGRSRGGFSTKIHLICDGAGHPLDFQLTGGQVHETQALVDVLNNVDEVVVDSDCNPIAWPLRSPATKVTALND